MNYRVIWTLDVEAESPQEAVEVAREMLPFAGSDSTATWFEVLDEHGEHLRLIDCTEN